MKRPYKPMIDPIEAMVPLLTGLTAGLFSAVVMIVVFGIVMFLTGPPISFTPH